MVEEKDTVDLVLLPYRIELYVNDLLVDEEWPAGERLFAFGDEINATVDPSVEQYYEVIEDEPNVTASFEDAEGWYPGGGIFVGD